VAWYDNNARNYDLALKLLGDNDDEFSAMRNKPTVEMDGCRVSHSYDREIQFFRSIFGASSV
jgi:hypothetical protein